MATLLQIVGLVYTSILLFNDGEGLSSPVKFPPICATVLCAVPNCLNPLPPPPGQCCPTCPAPTPALVCPKLPPDVIGLCVERCSADEDCSTGELCCSNGCGHECRPGVAQAGVCTYNGNMYKPGDSFQAIDGCNTCFCFGGVVACTKIACPQQFCLRDGVRYKVGQSFPAGDGCNNCICQTGGLIACTEIACSEIECSGGCESGGICYQIGDNFPAGDGCNFCSCIAPDRIVCTLIACLEPTTKPPPSCPVKGQIFKECGSACPANCTTPNPICTRQCVARCECPARQVIDEQKNQCVPRNKCPVEPTTKPPPSCPVKGQIFKECGSACPANCTTPNPICTLQCVARCECPAGQVINEQKNVCVPQDECPVEPTTKPPPSCPVKGQIFKECGSACPANCTTPNPICTRQCVARCECPAGQVINEQKNQCVPRNKCPAKQCPPQCSAAFCSRNKRAKCTLPGPREIPGCTGACQFTFCSACYFSEEPRSLPGRCKTCGSPIASYRCYKKWANCIGRRDIAQNGRTLDGEQTEENFRCYRYPCELRG